MTLSSYLESSVQNPNISDSSVESDAFGIRVGRLTCGRATDWEVVNLAERLSQSDYDLVIFRYLDDQDLVASQLTALDKRVWQADTVLYFCKEIGSRRTIEDAGEGITLEKVSSSQLTHEAGRVLDETFAGYRNHYSSNPWLPDLGTLPYLDWMKRTIETDEGHAWIIRDSEAVAVGIVVGQNDLPTRFEVNLAGIVPDARRRGYYQSALRILEREVQSLGVTEIAISTQSSNVNVIAAWCKEGFLPRLGVKTVHVMEWRV